MIGSLTSAKGITSVSQKKLLITGGSGDLGRVLSRRAVAADYNVTATYLTRPERIAAGKPINVVNPEALGKK